MKRILVALALLALAMAERRPAPEGIIGGGRFANAPKSLLVSVRAYWRVAKYTALI